MAKFNLPLPVVGDPVRIFRDLWRQNTSPWAIVCLRLRDPQFSRFDTNTAVCDGQADRHRTTAYTALA